MVPLALIKFNPTPLIIGFLVVVLMFAALVSLILVAVALAKRGKLPGAKGAPLGDPKSSPIVAHINDARDALMHDRGVEAIQELVAKAYPGLQPKEKADAGPQAKP